MLKYIFYIAEEVLCNKCWNQLAQAIKEVKNNNLQEINNLMFFKYYLKDQINTLVSKVIAIIKCNNNFYTLFWKEDLLVMDCIKKVGYKNIKKLNKNN
ncbi:hypothetical protein M1771_03210 [Spiroplasma citri]|uniref:hypothetical protein n=1 Tax=Spiroplasma citri TaxID=2133 RepID=UPI00241227E6|nr:hypothetical protein [Spiroplasma citri]WFH00925.1 hypothetical protein M1771_03210 [Spiroplasma citri]